MNGKRQWWMSCILYILAVNYDWKHLDSSQIELENLWIFFLPKEWEPCKCDTVLELVRSLQCE